MTESENTRQLPTGRLHKSILKAASRLRLEVRKQQKLYQDFDPDEIWASVTTSGRIQVGTPVLRPGDGYYVNHRGEWESA